MIKPYIHFDDIIFSVQKFGGASTYWREITGRIESKFPHRTMHSSAGRFSRLIRPKSCARIFHSSHFRISSSKGVRNVSTIHDLIYEKGMIGGKTRALNLFERRTAVANSDAIICISESTKRDMLEYYGELVKDKPVFVIHHGCTGYVDQIESSGSAPAPVMSQPACEAYFLFVGGRGGYKNFQLAAKAFAAGNFHKKGIKLLCTGAPFDRHELRFLEEYNVREFTRVIGIVSRSELKLLYGKAIALLYPSAYEGFGLPLLEAMSAACPVICCNTSSIPEVVGDAAILCEPHSIESLLHAMETIQGVEVRSQYIRKGLGRVAEFSWDISAEKHADVYRYVAPDLE